MAHSNLAETARSIFVQAVAQGKFNEQQLKVLADYSFTAAKVFDEAAGKIDRAS